MLTTPKTACYGCSACEQDCPTSAISMHHDEEGFLYPEVLLDLCIHCDLCNIVCPAQEEQLNYQTQPACYATWSADEILRSKSSSGGIFALLARKILQENGYVCGAVIESGYVYHRIISHVDDLEALQGSKYVQSDMVNCYSNIRNLLQRKHKVLFTGTPCQVAGLRQYLKKDYPTLLTADVVCHGTPSSKVWKSYLFSEFGEEEITTAFFRGKQRGWNRFSLQINSPTKQVDMYFHDNIYGKGFLSDLYLRPVCYQCEFATIPRQADISLGDFWHIVKYASYLDDDKGVSLTLVNTQRGRAAFQAIKDQLAVCKEIPLDFAKLNNPVLAQPSTSHPERANFFHAFNLKYFDFKRHTEYFLRGGSEVAILSRDWASDFGNCLSAYALQHTIHEIGYPTKLLYFAHEADKKSATALALESFAKKHLLRTEPIGSKQQIEQLNERFATFLLCSEIQVGNSKDYTGYQNLFDFVLPNKKLMAYGISAEASWENSTPLQRETLACCLNRFDALSTSTPAQFDALPEMSPTITESLDALFLCDADFWGQLADSCKDSLAEPYLACCLSSDIDQEAHNLGSHSLIDIKGASSVAHWVKLIRDCDVLLCNDYHALCMAIIFQKPFIVVEGEEHLSPRLKSLLEISQLSHRVLPMAKISKESLYQEFSANLRPFLHEGRHFLEKHLSIPCQNNKLTYISMLHIENKKMLQSFQFKYLRLMVWRYKILMYISWGKRRARYKGKLGETLRMMRTL